MPDETVRPLIQNIADLRASNAPVIMRETPAEPPPDPTGAYEVFLGRAGRIDLSLESADLALLNTKKPVGLGVPATIYEAAPSGLPEECLYIEVRSTTEV